MAPDLLPNTFNAQAESASNTVQYELQARCACGWGGMQYKLVKLPTSKNRACPVCAAVFLQHHLVHILNDDLGDLSRDAQIAPYIGTSVEFLTVCKSGFVQVKTRDGTLLIIPERNIKEKP